MKKLIVPLLIALLGGVGAGTGLTFVKASKQAAADNVRALAVADSVKAARKLAAADSAAKDTVVHATKDTLMTPAESIRAVVASRNPLKNATRNLPHAKADSMFRAPAGKAAGAGTAGTVDTIARATTKAPASKQPDVRAAAEAVRNARNDALNTSMPEERLAKIFSAMQAKDAAKVLDQMEDRDIRSVLTLMGDRQAAAILSALPPARAATITKGALKTSGADK